MKSWEAACIRSEMAPIYLAAATTKKSHLTKRRRKNIMRTGGGGRGSLGHLSQIFLGEHVHLPSLLYGNRWHLSLRNFTTTKKKEEEGRGWVCYYFRLFWKGKAQTGQKKVLFPLLFPSVVTAGKQCVCVQTLQGKKQVCLLSLEGGEGIFLNFRNFASPFFLLLVCSFWEIEARVTFF